MKKIFSILLLLLTVSSVSATGLGSKFSRLQSKKDKTTALSGQKKTDEVFESVRRQYSQGKITADSVVSLALYHKPWSHDVADKYLKLAASDGNPRAITELGVLYLFSPEYSNRAEEGLQLLQTAAKTGYNKANGYLGYYYFNQKDYAKAKSYFDALHPMTQGIEYAALGSMYLEGKGVREDGTKARECFRKASIMGLPRGMALYASLLGTKNGGPVDYPDAFFWHYIAGELGDNYSRVMLYLPRVPEAQATTEVGKDAQTALTWIEAVHKGKTMSNEPLYKDGFLKGLKAQEQAAEKGDDWARFYLGGMNYNGDFLNQNYTQALRYYEPIAQNGRLPRPLLALVHERLAKMYGQGQGTKANASKAAYHNRLAAQYGSLPAYKAVENIGN